jgi:hypothetical protein
MCDMLCGTHASLFDEVLIQVLHEAKGQEPVLARQRLKSVITDCVPLVIWILQRNGN